MISAVLSVKNTFLHFGPDAVAEAQPALGRALTAPPAGSGEPEEANNRDASQQPKVCRDTTFDAFESEASVPPAAHAGHALLASALGAWPTQPSTLVCPAGHAAQVAPAGVQAARPMAQPLPTLLPTLMPTVMLVGMAAPPATKSEGPDARPLPQATTAARAPTRKPAASQALRPAAPVDRASSSTRPTTRAPRALAARQPPLPPGGCELSRDGGALRLRWAVDARKLKKNERVIVSPLFDLPIKAGCAVPFRLMLFPKKEAGSFRAANGSGSILLKCEAAAQESPESTLAVRFSINRQPARGPVVHNFAQSGVCSLPEEIQEWNFLRAVDQASQSLVVRVEVTTRPM